MIRRTARSHLSVVALLGTLVAPALAVAAGATPGATSQAPGVAPAALVTADAPRVAFVGNATEDAKAHHFAAMRMHQPGDTSHDIDVDGRTVRFRMDPAPAGPWLGVLLEGQDEGVKVLSVASGSPAARAGLVPGDIILRLDDEAITGPGGLLAERQVGDRVRLTILRDGRERRLRARLDGHPGDVSFDVPEGMKMPSFSSRRMMAPMAPGAFALRGHPGGKPRLGVTLGVVSDQLGEYFGVGEGHGMLIESVLPDTPAERAGLEAGDVITRIGDTDISTLKDIRSALDEVEQDETVAIDVVRRGRNVTLTAILDSPVVQRGALGDAPGLHREIVVQRTAMGDADDEDVHVLIHDALQNALAGAGDGASDILADIDLEALIADATAGDGGVKVIELDGADGVRGKVKVMRLHGEGGDADSVQVFVKSIHAGDGAAIEMDDGVLRWTDESGEEHVMKLNGADHANVFVSKDGPAAAPAAFAFMHGGGVAGKNVAIEDGVVRWTDESGEEHVIKLNDANGMHGASAIFLSDDAGVTQGADGNVRVKVMKRGFPHPGAGTWTDRTPSGAWIL